MLDRTAHIPVIRGEDSPSETSFIRKHPFATAAAGIVSALAMIAIVNRRRARLAERDNPPIGGFLSVGGVRVHYVDRGAGEPLVLLHGNGSMIEDFESSGLIDLAAKRYRVIVFDRPGFGHSRRPRGLRWTPDEQAILLASALQKLGVTSAVIAGHSWGATLAVAMALRYPDLVRGLVLASGYYYPSFRPDFWAMSTASLPVVGDIACHTVMPVLSRLVWPLLLRHLFGPPRTPEKFRDYPKEMAVRPSQLRAAAQESALTVPDAAALETRYGELKMPIVILAGEQDRLIDIHTQSARLHAAALGSKFHSIACNGHMIHQTATGDFLSAVDEAIALAVAGQQPHPA